MAFKIATLTLASAVATSGTFTVSYPEGTTAGTFRNAVKHVMTALGAIFTSPNDFAITAWGASSATITWRGATTLPAGTLVRVQFGIPGPDSYRDAAVALPDGVIRQETVRLLLGSPATADADGVCASQAGTAATAMTINGALASGGVAVFDVPRNVVGAWTNSATLTITGTDEYGETVVETTGSAGTSHTGVKAFKTITSVVPSASITGATVGTGDVLGLPVFLPSTAAILKELEDGAAATSGTAVAGLSPATVSTATTADVRGTYDPNSACNGTKAFDLVVTLADPTHRGNPQYAG